MAFFRRIKKPINNLWYPQSVTWGKAVTTREVAGQTTHQTVSSQLRVRTQIIKGPYFNSDSTNTGVPDSKSPAYPTHQLPKFNVKL